MYGAYRALRPLIAAGFYYSGMVPVARWWTRRAGRRLIILIYHRAAGGDLRRHLLYLRQHYRILPLEAALEELYAPPRADRRAQHDPRTPLAITFDDGYRDNDAIAAQLARELQIPITIFLPPGYIGSGSRYHWREGEHLARHARVERVTIAERTYRLDRPAERHALVQTIHDQARNAPSVAAREAFLAATRAALAVPTEAPEEDAAARPLTWDQVRAMEARGQVTFGAHTMHHPNLGSLVDRDEVRHEVIQSRHVLERELGHPVRTFAYPYGGVCEIGAHGIAAAREAGCEWAVSTIPGHNTPESDRYLLKRIPTDVSEHWWVLAAQTAGVWWGVWGILARLGRYVTRWRSARAGQPWGAAHPQTTWRSTAEVAQPSPAPAARTAKTREEATQAI